MPMPAARPRLLVHPFSWRSRYFRGMLLLVFLVLAMRLSWGWHARGALQAQLDEVRRRGEPVTLEELTSEPIPDADNAWTLQVKAAGIAVRTGVSSPSASNDEYRDFPPFPGYWMKRAAASEAAHGQVFALARQARQLPRAQIRGALSRPAVGAIVWPTTLNQARHLANTLKDGALYAHVQGDDVEAVERVRDELHVERSLHADPTLVSQLVGVGIGASANSAAQAIAPGLRLEKPGTRQAVRGLIADLLDESADWRGFEAGLRGERVIVDDYVDWMAQESWFTRPMADMEAVRRNRYYAALIELAPTPNWPAASAAIDRIPGQQARNNALLASMTGPPRRPTVPRYSRFLMSDQWESGLSRYFLTHFRCVADRRMTAVSLAAQLYRADHGRWPPGMEELAPAYLPKIPVDPYRADGGPLTYVLEKLPAPLAGDRPLVYCEDHERAMGITAEPMYGFQSSTFGRIPSGLKPGQYRDLSRFEPPSSPQAVDGDPNKPDAPGGEAEKHDGAKQP